MRPSKIISQFECSKNQVPNPLFRVQYSGNQSLKARCKASFKTTRDFKTAVELHLQWCSCEPTPFVSLFADHEHATKWAQRLLEHGYTDVILLEIDSTKLGSLFNVRELVDHQEIKTSLPEYLYQDEFLVLHEIPKTSIITKTIVNRCETSVNYDSSDSSEEEIDTPLSQYLKALDVEYEKRFSLYHLGDLLTWTPASAPRGQLVLLEDCVEAGGAFLVHHFTSLFLKAGHRVCFVASANTVEHYAAVGRKMGVNFAACETKKQLKVVNWGEMETKEAEWTMLFEELKSFTQEEQDAGVSIIVDDISPFKWRFGDAAVLDFVRCCKTLTHDKNGAANVVLLTHADTDVAISRPLSPTLADMATVVLSTKPLATGYSKDIHGTLEVCCQNRGEEPVAVAYKVLESTIKCFHSGGQALRWN